MSLVLATNFYFINYGAWFVLPFKAQIVFTCVNTNWK